MDEWQQRPPHDLPEMMTLTAVAGPGNARPRALKRQEKADECA